MPTAEQVRRVGANIPNPFEERPPRIQEYTAKEIATLQCRLERQLGPEYISTRPGNGGGKVAYLAAEKAIILANEVFGFNGWSSEVKKTDIDFVDESQSTGRVSLGISVIMRVTLRDGTFHEDIGYGQIENAKGKAVAFEKAKKEAATDAMKRALRNFGNVLGNCLYDKTYLTNVQKIKIKPTRFDEAKLHRHTDYAPQETPQSKTTAPPAPPRPAAAVVSAEGAWRTPVNSEPDDEDEFGSGTLFDEVDMDHYHDALEVTPVKEESHPSAQNPNGSADRRSERKGGQSNPQAVLARSNPPPKHNGYNSPHPIPPNRQAGRGPPENKTIQTAQAQAQGIARPQSPAQPPAVRPESRATPQPPNVASRTLETSEEQVQTSTDTPVTRPPVGFVTSRAADALNRDGQTGPSPRVQAFTPHAGSPSIRRTSGFNHNTSAPVTKEGSGSGASYYVNQPKNNYMNPMADPTRRIGAPGARAASPMANRSTYKPPQPVKRPAEGDARPALADKNCNLPEATGMTDAADKKPRLDA